MTDTAKLEAEIEALGFHPCPPWSEGAAVTVSAEHGDNAADYYGEGALLLQEELGRPVEGAGLPWVNPKLEEWARGHGFYWEWVNPGVIAAYRVSS